MAPELMDSVHVMLAPTSSTVRRQRKIKYGEKETQLRLEILTYISQECLLDHNHSVRRVMAKNFHQDLVLRIDHLRKFRGGSSKQTMKLESIFDWTVTSQMIQVHRGWLAIVEQVSRLLLLSRYSFLRVVGPSFSKRGLLFSLLSERWILEPVLEWRVWVWTYICWLWLEL